MESPTRTLSISEIRHWCESNFTRGESYDKINAFRELPRRGFCRAVGLDKGNFQRFLDGERDLSPRIQRVMSRFILQWEAGLLEFTGHHRNKKSTLVHRATPRPVPLRMTLVFSDGPKLRMAKKLPAPENRIFLTAKAK